MAIYSVILERAKLGSKVWDHGTKHAAESRADSLAELHGISTGLIQVTSNEAGDTTYVVPASGWYDK